MCVKAQKAKNGDSTFRLQIEVVIITFTHGPTHKVGPTALCDTAQTQLVKNDVKGIMELAFAFIYFLVDENEGNEIWKFIVAKQLNNVF